MKQETGIGALAQRIRTRQIPFSWVVIAVFVVVMAILPIIIRNPYYMNIVILVLLMGYLSTAWGMVGQTGQLSFGHVAFLGLAAYTSTILYEQFGVTPWVGGLAGAAIAVAAGAVIGFPTLRLRGVYFALATLAFAFILQIFIMNTFELGPIWIGATPGIHITLVHGGNAPEVFQFRGKIPYYFIALGMLIGILALNLYLNRSRMGYYWRAIRDDPDAAESLGINVAKYRIRAFLLSCFLTGLGGVFYAQYFLTVDPRRILDLGFSIEIAVIGIVGGWQSVFGPFFGAVILTPIGELIRARMYHLPGLYLVIYGFMLVMFMLFLPKGLNSPIMRGLRSLEAKFWRSAAEGNKEIGS